MQARALKEELPTDAIEVRCPGACVLLMNRVARKLSLPQHSPAGTSRHLHAGKRAHICPPWPAQKVFQSAPCKASVSWDTLQAVFAALLQANEPVLSMEILKVCFSSCLWSPSGRTCIMLNHS